MQITLDIPKETAQLAVAYALFNGYSIKTKTEFEKAVETFVIGNGSEPDIDDSEEGAERWQALNMDVWMQRAAPIAETFYH